MRSLEHPLVNKTAGTVASMSDRGHRTRNRKESNSVVTVSHGFDVEKHARKITSSKTSDYA